MALRSSVSKAQLNVADMDRHYYQQHNLTLAQHPSETDERLLLRVLAFALHASEFLAFTKGLSTEDEPDLLEKNLTGDIDVWIELGLPSEKRIRKACGRAQRVFIYTYGRGTAEMWWKQMQSEVARFNNLTIIHIPPTTTKALAGFAGRNLDVQVNIQEGDVTWHCGADSLVIEQEVLKQAVL